MNLYYQERLYALKYGMYKKVDTGLNDIMEDYSFLSTKEFLLITRGPKGPEPLT